MPYTKNRNLASKVSGFLAIAILLVMVSFVGVELLLRATWRIRERITEQKWQPVLAANQALWEEMEPEHYVMSVDTRVKHAYECRFMELEIRRGRLVRFENRTENPFGFSCLTMAEYATPNEMLDQVSLWLSPGGLYGETIGSMEFDPTYGFIRSVEATTIYGPHYDVLNFEEIE